MNEELWMRIVEAARVLADARDESLPADLTQTRGTVWERDAQRRRALGEFCQTVGLPTFEPGDDLESIANLLDDAALHRMERVEADEDDK